jgi:hypothetical protein
MKRDCGWLPSSPFGWALGFSSTVLLFASVHVAGTPSSRTVRTVEPRITTVAVRPVAYPATPFVSETVCFEALQTERRHGGIMQSRELRVSHYYCERLAAKDSIEMVSAQTMPRLR